MISATLPVYSRAKLAFERGEGARLYLADGTEYLDFMAGIAVNCLGHAHPYLVNALTEQAKKLWHVSNVFEIPGYEKLAQRLVDHSFADTVFFSNSGTEAIEGAIKMVRKYHRAKGKLEKFHFITFKGAFHGRTIAAASAAGGKNIEGFEPALEGFTHVPFNDIEAVKKAITPQTGAILIEPIQGEGGVSVASAAFLKELRNIADAHDILLVFDEVQCGMGRTGTLFAHELFGVTPDIAASAKGIGGGFPLGAILATERAASGMEAGTHGSTYGGNPLAMAVGNAVMDIMLKDGFFASVTKISDYFGKKLQELQQAFPQLIKEVRGAGLIRGLQLVDAHDSAAVVVKLREQKLLAVRASDNVVRLLPPLIITEHDVDDAIRRMTTTFKAL